MKVFRWHYVNDLIRENIWTRGAELGVFDGKFTSFLLENNPSLRMISVDLWETQPGNDTSDGGESYESWDHEGNYKSFIEKLGSNRDRSDILRMTTSEASGKVDNESLDFVFIDACHSFECVVRDIKNWSPKVKSGGMVIGHDWPWPSVNRAVKSVYDSDKIIIGPNKCWAVWK